MATVIAILTALPGFFSLLEKIGPELGTLITGLVTWINHISGNDPQGFSKRLGIALSALDQAQSEEERIRAAKNIADFFRSVP